MDFQSCAATTILMFVFLSCCNAQSAPDSIASTTQLDEVIIRGRKLVERDFGIRRRGVVSFSDGMFEAQENFEIGQVVRLGNSMSQVISASLYITSARADSATFRIRFYKYDPGLGVPGQRINTRIVQQRHPVRQGWLKFDLSASNIFLRGDVLASIEFIPDAEVHKKILYEVKLGGTSKSFYRRNGDGAWMRPPHHYCLYVTAITDPAVAPDEEDVDTAPAMIINSDFSNEPYSIFVRLPRDYANSDKKFPVVYLLDGNAYFDAVSSTADIYAKKKKIKVDPIIVGLGYENAYVMDSLRSRDYTFPEATNVDDFGISGRGDKYYNFIESKIKPVIDSVYRTDKSNQTIMGHSFGGYFVLYALSRSLQKPLFNNFVAASPSLFYNNGHIIDRLDTLLHQVPGPVGMKVIATIGEMERSAPGSEPFDELIKTLRASPLPVESITYAKTEHMGTAISTFERGLILLFGKK